MHVRVSTKRINGKTYSYTQIVESYRRPDGMPAHRVVHNLGRLSKEASEAVRVALRVAKAGEAVVLASEAIAALQGSTVANLRYLDIAVLLDCWKGWGLQAELDLLAAELVDTDPDVSLASTLFPLVAQRCCAPASKLEATRWVPTTALPELIGFDPAVFNNSRVHRTLMDLYTITDRLQERLPRLYQEHDGAFTAMFMDTTDTHFEGIGCPMAEQTKTKSEMPHKRCLSIVLLVNEHGLPLRWKVLGGKTKDWTAMSGTLDDLADVPWLQNTPIVFDRAMGQLSTVAKLKATGLHFLTAAHVTSIESYTHALPHAAFAELQLEGTDDAYERDIERVAQAARDAGLEEIHPRLFAIDLGVAPPARELEADTQVADAVHRHRGLAGQILRARSIRDQMDASPDLPMTSVALSHAISVSRLKQLLGLLRFAPEVQERILELGASCPVTEPQARGWHRLPPDEQLSKFDSHVPEASLSPANGDEPAIGPLRMAAYFNPRLFVDIRRRTQGHCDDLGARVDALNKELAAVKQSRKELPTHRKFSREIERLRYLDLFDVDIEEIEVTSPHGTALRSYRGSITRREDAWQRRRRYDGFVLLLAHPDLQRTATGLVEAYRSKDVVEKDFQTIKSLEKLRPVFHHTDPKVQAHVTVCMLALLLQRSLRRRLAQAGLEESTPSALGILSTCHLNQRAPLNGSATYDITQPNADQRRILEACGLESLATGEYAAAKLRPRQVAA